MNKLTEIKERVKAFNDDPQLYGVVMTVDEMNFLISLLEEKEKALAFYAEGENWELPEFGRGHSLVTTDRGKKARDTLLTSSNNEGEK